MKTLDDVMPQVNLFAQQINEKVFGKPEEKPQAASAEAEAAATRDPELILQKVGSPLDEKETVPIVSDKPPVSKADQTESNVNKRRSNPFTP
jgi:hypothetical protein